MVSIARARRSAAAAILIAAVALASGCAPGSPAADSAEVVGTASSMTPGLGSSVGATSEAAGPSSAARQATGASIAGPKTTERSAQRDGVDALTLTGPADVVDVPDMQPVITDPHPSFPATVTDANGRRITIERADRVIALDLYGTLVDTIIGLGLTDRLVGRGASDTQDAVAHLPVVSTDGIGLSAEAVLSLKPDVLLTTMTIGNPQVYDQIDAAGVTVVRFDTVPSLAELPESMTRVGAVFGMAEQADELAEHTEAQLEDARATIDELAAETPRRPRALVIYLRGTAGIFFIFGAGYGVSDILAELHLEDIATEAGIEKLVPAGPESLVSLDPDIILTMRAGLATGGGVPALLKRPGISATTAGMNERIITAADAQLLSYGPRTPASLVAIAKAIYEPANG